MSEDNMAFCSTDHLIQEHRLIQSAVYTAKAMADRLKMPEAENVEALSDFFRHFADEHHETKQEPILFPSPHQRHQIEQRHAPDGIRPRTGALRSEADKTAVEEMSKF